MRAMSIETPTSTSGQHPSDDTERALAGGTTRKIAPRVARAGEVLDLIRRGEATTTTELSRTMGLARSTVTERLDALQRVGLLVPAGETTPSRGRPAGILAFNSRAGITLVAQVGMTGTLLAITDLAAEVLWSEQVLLDVAEGPTALFELLRDEFEGALATVGHTRDDIYGIAIGLPGDIEIASSPTRDRSSMRAWSDHQLAERFGQAFGVTALVDRDVNLMAIGEHRSSWPEAEVFLCLKVGTVIACGLVIGNQAVRGRDGLVGEIGHTKVAGSEHPCACGSQGCLNTVAGGHALAQQLVEAGYDAKGARDVATLANAGNLVAGQAVRAAGRQIGEVMAGVINLLNPDVITVWGYLVDAGDQFLAGMQEAVYKTALPSSARGVQIAHAQLGDDAGLRGAALTVIEQTLRPDLVEARVAAMDGA